EQVRAGLGRGDHHPRHREQAVQRAHQQRRGGEDRAPHLSLPNARDCTVRMKPNEMTSVSSASRMAVAAAAWMSLRVNASRSTFSSGLHVDGSALVSGRSVVGSAYTWSVAMIEKTAVMTSAGATSGTLIRSASWSSEQPSMRADSYSSREIAWSAVYSTI